MTTPPIRRPQKRHDLHVSVHLRSPRTCPTDTVSCINSTKSMHATQNPTETMKQRCLFLFVFALLLPIIAAKGGLVGGWTPIEDPKDPHVVEIGQFAVSEYNKRSKTGLMFERVVKGETQVVSGTNYRLVLVAKDGSATAKFQAVVWEKPWQHFKNLTSFKPIN